MSERIFISYRRDDSRGYAGRLQSDLSRRFANEAVYRDVETHLAWPSASTSRAR